MSAGAARAAPLALIAAEIGEGASDAGCRHGAAALRASGLAAALSAAGAPARWAARVRPPAAATRLGAVAGFSQRLFGAVQGALQDGRRPVVVGGDHSCAVGTWSAVADALRPAGALGLVWVDAHLDAHTPATSDSQAPHGMPVAALLGHGAPALTGLGGWRGKVRPAHLAIVGARSFEPAEAALLQGLGVRVIGMGEVRRRGLADCFAEACAIARRGTAGWGLSFDLDALDPRDAPGTGTPVDGGIRLGDAVAALRTLRGDPALRAFELAEYNPLRDAEGRTALAAHALLVAALAPAAVQVPAECY